MEILITDASGVLQQALAGDLRPAHAVRLTSRQPLTASAQFVRSDLGHDESTSDLVAGIETIIHQPEPVDQTAAGWIDAGTRCTYNLLMAGAEAGVKQVIFLSSLDLMAAYEPNKRLDHEWAARPSCQPRQLGLYLGEFIVREFAYTGTLKVLCLRLGHPISPDRASEFDPMGVDVDDVVAAIAAGLDKPLADFQILHLQSVSDRARFETKTAWETLGVQPQAGLESSP